MRQDPSTSVVEAQSQRGSQHKPLIKIFDEHNGIGRSSPQPRRTTYFTESMSASMNRVSRNIQARRDSTFLVLAGLFLGTLGMLNILGLTRFLALGQIGSWPIVVAVGALPYPVTFLCTDLISELWGEERATQLVWVGFLLNGWVVLILWLGGLLPGLNGAPNPHFLKFNAWPLGRSEPRWRLTSRPNS